MERNRVPMQPMGQLFQVGCQILSAFCVGVGIGGVTPLVSVALSDAGVSQSAIGAVSAAGALGSITVAFGVPFLTRFARPVALIISSVLVAALSRYSPDNSQASPRKESRNCGSWRRGGVVEELRGALNEWWLSAHEFR